MLSHKRRQLHFLVCKTHSVVTDTNPGRSPCVTRLPVRVRNLLVNQDRERKGYLGLVSIRVKRQLTRQFHVVHLIVKRGLFWGNLQSAKGWVTGPRRGEAQSNWVLWRTGTWSAVQHPPSRGTKRASTLASPVLRGSCLGHTPGGGRYLVVRCFRGEAQTTTPTSGVSWPHCFGPVEMS